MATILVDANIILGFWSLRVGRVPSDLLLPLVDLSNHILITRQIADEVTRNKLRVFLQNSDAAISPTLPPALPDQLVRSRKLEEFNKSLDALKKGADDVRKKWPAIRAQLAAEIDAGTDMTTGQLSKLMAKAQAPTDEQIAAARLRKERGNPPGKKGDPLGDQISWQQFLDAVKGADTAWIVTRDGDFYETLDKTRMLNPLLKAELAERGVKTIHLFDSLSVAIKAMQAAGLKPVAEGLKAVPKIEDAKLDKLAKEEARALVPHPPYATWPDRAWECPSCHHVNLATTLTAGPSYYGGWSYWTRCDSCGFRIDTGEPYDD